MNPLRLKSNPAVVVYDRMYRLYRGLDRPRAAVPPALRVEVRRSWRDRRLDDGAVIRPGDRIGVLHLDNTRIAGLHVDGAAPMATGLHFRRELLTSLRALADQAQPGGPLADVQAFAAITIFHRGLRRLGFELASDGLRWPGLAAAYQRALLATLHPAGLSRVSKRAYSRAARLWISREKLLALYLT